jgi:hypothetical protein
VPLTLTVSAPLTKNRGTPPPIQSPVSLNIVTCETVAGCGGAATAVAAADASATSATNAPLETFLTTLTLGARPAKSTAIGGQASRDARYNGVVSPLREGGCSCGVVRYRLASDPLFVHCCHCLNCQRQTGSAFVVNVVIETDRVELLAGEPQPVDVPRDDGSVQTIFRCPVCQVAVFSQYTHPGMRFVRGGTLDDPSTVSPDVHIYTRSKLRWVTLPEDIPAFDVYYDAKALWPESSLRRLRALQA